MSATSVRGVLNKVLGRYDFEGHYKSFWAIKDPTSHDNAEFANAAVDLRLRNWPGPYAIDLLPIVAAGYNDVTVVDVGGGASTGASQLVSSGVAGYNYILVETPSMCAAVNQHGPKFVVTESMPGTVKRPCIVNAASVLQYIDNWPGALEDFARLKPEAIIISNTPMSDESTYVRCQINGSNRRIPAWCFNHGDLMLEMTRLGYNRRYYIEHPHTLRHKNAPGPSVQASMIYFPA